ncbi:MAG TPA: aminotransferase class I/II-fold pyridoxal phosphate-dependent enzyme, partial [Candidimonas sp.]|nr:aminotransferase class I/II-fold pyridoxal phosphate-dependent enzyme [Candidimonas sp.]
GLNRVIQIGSFSKTLSASVRCGYIATRPDWIDELVDLKIATAFAGSQISQELVLTMLKDGSYRKHLETLRLRLATAMRDTTQRLADIGITPWITPRAGMFLWCKLPAGLNATDMAKQALQQGIVLAPGNVFSLSQSATGLMRFNVSQMSDKRIFKLLETAIKSAG